MTEEQAKLLAFLIFGICLYFGGWMWTAMMWLICISLSAGTIKDIFEG